MSEKKEENKEPFGIYLIKWFIISIIVVTLFIVLMIIAFAFLNTYVSKKCSYEIEKNYKNKMHGFETRLEALELKLMFRNNYDFESTELSIGDFKDDKDKKKSEGVQKP